MERDGVETVSHRQSCSPHPVPLPARLPPVQCWARRVRVLASWRRQHGSRVRFVDARVVSQSLCSLTQS